MMTSILVVFARKMPMLQNKCEKQNGVLERSQCCLVHEFASLPWKAQILDAKITVQNLNNTSHDRWVLPLTQLMLQAAVTQFLPQHLDRVFLNKENCEDVVFGR